MSSLQEALAAASSSDVISFCHNGTNYCLVAALDSINGGLKWDNDTSDNASITRHLRTKKWIAPMLNDKPRNHFYSRAISKAVRQAVEKKMAGGRGKKIKQEKNYVFLP